MPTFNHSRADGPYDPCPKCLRKMTREQLIALVSDLQETIRDLRESDDEAIRSLYEGS